MTEPSFSVLVPAYDVERTIEPALRSVLVQTRQDFEVVVVDDGSRDATAARVEAIDDPRIRLVRQENRGLAGARNTAIREARAPLLCLLDGDDLWLPTYLAQMSATLAAAPDAGFAWTDAWLLDDVTRRVGRRTAMALLAPPAQPPPDARSLLVELLHRNFLLAFATIRRDALDRVGGFDESLRAAEDYELWLRFAARGVRGVPAPEPLALYRRRAGSLTRDDRLMWAQLQLVYERVSGEPDLPEDARTQAREASVRAARRADPRGARAIRQRAQLAAGRAWRRATGDRFWTDEPPPAVAAAFPDLRAV